MSFDWRAETLRLSIFSSEIVKFVSDDWKKITGEESPKAEQKVVGRHTMSGPLLDGLLSLSVSGARYDCILHPLPPPEDIPETYVPQIGTWPEVFTKFVAATEEWLADLSVPIVRIAVGAVLLASFPGLTEAYRAVLEQALKSVKGNPEKMRDLIFRVNWPVSSTSVDDLSINRLTTWQVVRHELVLLRTGPNVVNEQSPSSYFARLEIDHNTAAGRTQAFDHDKRIAIYNELAKLALQNAEQGELP